MPTCTNCGRENPEDAGFCNGCGRPLGRTAQARDARKTVTVLFCDVVGSTAMGEALDPESLRRVMDLYFDAMRAEVERHGGSVEKFIGDAVMAVFGVPAVHEDDALRATRAAVGMREALVELNKELERDYGVHVANRVGIDTGEVVTSNTVTGERIATGDAVNTAARLEQAAGSNEIFIGEPTFRLVRDAIDAEPIEPVEAKGKAAPVAAWRVVSVAEGVEGFARRRDTPIVGRATELRLLADALDRAQREHACVLVTILGSAGVGKSRLVEEFLGSEAQGGKVLRGRCLPYGEGITFWPLVEMLTTAAGLSGIEDPRQARGKLRSLLGDDDEADIIVERLGQLLGIEGTEAVAEETFWAVRKLFELLAGGTALVVDLDDLHWAEPTLLDLIEHVADWSRDAPILLLCSARPELLEGRPQWAGGKMNATSFLLEPLGDAESAEVVGNLLDGRPLPQAAVDQIEAAAEGNPLFIEQTVAMLVDEGALERSEEGLSLGGEPDALAVPPTIQALLAARLDRLAPDERAVIERASIEGKVFHRAGVLALCDQELRASVDAHIGALLRRDLIRPQAALFASDQAFRFRHMLIRDAAYDGMSKELRAELHEGFADWLASALGERIELEEIVAYHLERAVALRSELGPIDDEARAAGERAATLLIDGGERAVRRGDITAAAALWRRAVDLLPEGDLRMSAIAVATSAALTLSGSSEQSLPVLRGALARAEAEGSGEAVAGIKVVLAMRLAMTDPANNPSELIIHLCEEAERLIATPENRRLLGWVRFAGAIGHRWLGRMDGSAALCERILTDRVAAADPLLERSAVDALHIARTLGVMPVAEALLKAPGGAEREPFRELEIALLLALHGEAESARRACREALARADELGLPVARARAWAGIAELLTDPPEVAERDLRAGYEAIMREGNRGFANTVVGYLARAMHAAGHGKDALPLLSAHADTPADDYEAIGLQRAAHSMILADKGDLEQAESLAREGVAALAPTEDLIRQGETLMALAHVLRVAGREDEAIRSARDAADLFERKGDVPDAERTRIFLAGTGPATRG